MSAAPTNLPKPPVGRKIRRRNDTVQHWLDQRRDQAALVTRCAHCDWHHHGTFADGRDAYANHHKRAHRRHA